MDYGLTYFIKSIILKWVLKFYVFLGVVLDQEMQQVIRCGVAERTLSWWSETYP